MFFSMPKIIWHTILYYFGLVMELAEDSRPVALLISCTMALAVILNVESGRAVFQEVARRVTNLMIRTRLDRYPSPVPIASSEACRRQLKQPLMWTQYDDLPLAMLLENNGSTVILRSCHPAHSLPRLSGGGLGGGSYHFMEAIFKWGAEHSIDGQKFSLEMQVLHCWPQRKKYLALSYLFVRSRYRNDALKQITENLKYIRCSGSSIELPPFELETLLPIFGRDYFSYQGTYYNGEIELPVTWLIDPQPGRVRFQQVNEFIALCGANGRRIKSNGRVERSLGRRSVQFHY